MPTDDYAIDVQDLTTHYGERKILDGISFQARQGEIMVIMGGSGSGKSTLLRHLLGLNRPTSGSIRLLDPSMPEGEFLEGADTSIREAAGLPLMAFNPDGEPVDILNHFVNFGWEYVYPAAPPCRHPSSPRAAPCAMPCVPTLPPCRMET